VIRDGEIFTEALGNLFEAVFFTMSMLRRKLRDSVEVVKIAVQYEDAYQRLSDREEEMDENEGNEFVPTGFGFTSPADMPDSLTDEWPHEDESILPNVNINSWCRLALLSIATFQFSAALAQNLGATDDAAFLARHAACLENMGESVCRYTKIARETFSKSVERAKPCVFGILTGLLEGYKNDDDDTTRFLDEDAEYVGIYEELKDRLGALGEPRGFGDSISGEESKDHPDDISMEDLEYKESPEEPIHNDTMRETEDEFSNNLMEEPDCITIPEMSVPYLEEEMQSHSEEDPN
jgi:hypothetical protein